MSDSGTPVLGWVRDLPEELQDALVRQAEFSDLKALSLVSQRFHRSASRRMFETLIIPVQEKKLERLGSQAYYRLYYTWPLPVFVLNIRHLHFGALFHQRWWKRCPHRFRFLEDSFVAMSQMALLLLRLLRRGSLESFSWDMGTCVPGLGKQGVLNEAQSKLKSLSLITAGYCRSHTDGISLDPSALEGFESIRKFSWKGISSHEELESLQDFLNVNTKHLEELHLDLTLVRWNDLSDELGWNEATIFIEDALSRTLTGSSMTFSALKVLSISGLPFSSIGVQIAQVLSIGQLRSLQLRHCKDTADLLYKIVESGQSLQLKEFEIMVQDKTEDEWSDTALISFLQSFEGLEHLHIMVDIDVSFLEYWRTILRHHSTLRRFVYHHRITSWMEDTIDDYYDRPVNFWEDESTGGSFLAEFFAAMDFECLGLCDNPDHLRDMLGYGAIHQHLKLLHIRRSALDEDNIETILEHLAAFLKPESRLLPAPHAIVWREDFDYAQACNWFRFSTWAFGCKELPGLQVLALGDFSYDGRFPKRSMLLCRDSLFLPGYTFRIMDRNETAPLNGISRPWDFLGACPKDTLLCRDYSIDDPYEWPGSE